MSEMKHTPGPWVQGDGDPEHILCASSFACVATVNTSLSDWEAIARLIAAAPDLLDGLKAFYKAYVNTLESARDRIISLGGSCDSVDQMEQGDHALVRARQLIAKAQGHAHE